MKYIQLIHGIDHAIERARKRKRETKKRLIVEQENRRKVGCGRGLVEWTSGAQVEVRRHGSKIRSSLAKYSSC